MWQYFPGPIIFQFVLLVLTLICYFFDIFIIVITRTYRMLAIRLFLYQCIFQLITFLPQFFIPYFTNPDAILDKEHKDKIIGSKLCNIEGVLIIYGWLGASILSIYMTHQVYQVLCGNSVRNSFKYDLKTIIPVLLVLPIPFIIYAITPGYQIAGWVYQNQDMYSYCTFVYEDNRRFLDNFVISILSIIDLGIIITTIYYRFKIKKQRKVLVGLGVNCNQPILKCYSLALIQTILWTLNVIFKVSGNLLLAKKKNIFLSSLWVILNCLYITIGITVTFLFMRYYLPYMSRKMNPKFYSCLKRIFLFQCCKCFEHLKLKFQSTKVNDSYTNSEYEESPIKKRFLLSQDLQSDYEKDTSEDTSLQDTRRTAL